MRCAANHQGRILVSGIGIALLLAVVPIRAGAQINPLWDHYKVYLVNPPIPYPVPGPPVTLIDQFTTSTHQVEFLERFMNPTEKVHLGGGSASPINEPFLH